MANEQLTKLRPDRDLQCYFERPSAIAAISGASANGFTLSGTWRQQFDWAVVEWNRDNVFEHPLFRNLPDGDLSGLVLQYDEERENCIAIDSDLYATVDWPSLRVWAQSGESESLYKVKLKSLAEPLEGNYRCASASFTLQGSVSAGDYVGIAFLDEHHTYQVYATDTLDKVCEAICASINAFSSNMTAEQNGTTITVSYAQAGINGNRYGAYAYASTGSTLSWDKSAAQLAGGESPTKWRVTINFASLRDENGQPVPTTAVRKLRWTYSAGLQHGAFVRSEFAVRITNWSVTGSRLYYQIAGPGSRRIENDSADVTYTGTWKSDMGNFSGGTIHSTTEQNATATVHYSHPLPHTLYLGSRYAFNAGTVAIAIDGETPLNRNLLIPGEDVLCRIPLGELAAGEHTVSVTNLTESYLYFDFMEIAQPHDTLPATPVESRTTLATDWDTDHSIALAAERTAWMIDSLGFRGRVNHYVGALWFYELTLKNHAYTNATITFSGDALPNTIVALRIASETHPDAVTTIQHLVHVGDTIASIVKALEMKLNSGYTGLRGEAAGTTLTIFARALAPQDFTLSATSSNPALTVSSSNFGGSNPNWQWITDLNASPAINRAARDWSRAFFADMKKRGIDGTSAFSMELQHGDTSEEAGIAQRYPSGNPVTLNTPALQTNFSPTVTAYYKRVYADMAAVMSEAGVQPYLQFGEVQWWYFPYDGTGMPFYDAYTQSQFFQRHNTTLRTIPDGSVSPQSFPEEAAFLPTLIGEFTDAVIAHVRQSYPSTRFEVLYPVDVNDGAFNSVINYPTASWTPQKLDNLKTESFTYTYARNLDLCKNSINYAHQLAFPPHKRSHLIGISDPIAPWRQEVNLSQSESLESVVLFALDQFCLIGYSLPLQPGSRSSSLL